MQNKELENKKELEQLELLLIELTVINSQKLSTLLLTKTQKHTLMLLNKQKEEKNTRAIVQVCGGKKCQTQMDLFNF